MRLTRYGSDSFERFFATELKHLGQDCLEAAGSNLLAVILGGGYGRGEGAVMRDHTRDRELPYNDLDLFLVWKKQPRGNYAALEEARLAWEHRLGIEVDFSRPLTPQSIQRWPRALMWHDLLLGHIVIGGSPDILHKNAPASTKEHPLPIEALRLLLNRGAGLAWAREVAAGNTPAIDDDFVRRNIMKALLAAGDAVLIAHGQHHHLVADRAERLAELAANDPAVAALDLVEDHAAAALFKSDPSTQPGELDESMLDRARQNWLRSMLHTEGKRTGNEYLTSQDYVDDHQLREPDRHTFSQRCTNLARNLRDGNPTTLYPREHLYRELTQILEGPSDLQRTERMLDIWRRVA